MIYSISTQFDCRLAASFKNKAKALVKARELSRNHGGWVKVWSEDYVCLACFEQGRRFY